MFDKAWREVEFHTSRHGAGMPVSSTRPALGCRAAVFRAANVTAAQGDTYVRTAPLLQENGAPVLDENDQIVMEQTSYSVADIRSDGISGWLILILTEN